MTNDKSDQEHWKDWLLKTEADLEALKKKSQVLINVRDSLRELLKLPVQERAETTPQLGVDAHTGTTPTFRRGDFYGLSQAKAAYNVLERAGGSLRTEEILNVLTDAGYAVGGEEPRRTLYSSLCRSRRLVLVAPNTFDLAERRPKPRKAREGGKQESEKRKTQAEEQHEIMPREEEDKSS